MLGLGKTGTVRAAAAAGSGCSRDIYRRYAVALYTQALLNVDDPASAEQVHDAAVNERALALVRARGEDDARHRRVLGMYPRDMTALLRAALRRLTTSLAAAVPNGDQVGGPAAGGE
jgi:hypothetical protein